MNKTASFTGQRPKDLGSYNPKDLAPFLWEVQKVIISYIENKNCDTFIAGGALGFDLWAARIVIKLKEKYPHIKLISALPCRNQSKMWSKASQEEWQFVIDNSDEVVLVTDEDYKPYLMQKRNEFMVDKADFIIAGHNGNTHGGTFNCLQYARKKIKEENITIINPNDYV